MVFKPHDATYVQITQQLPPFVVPLTQAPMGFFNDDAVCTHAESKKPFRFHAGELFV
jgi:hypothetical protein